MTKEEIIISLGLDQTQATKGMQAFNFIAKESIGDTLKGIKRLVGINMVEMAQDAIRYWSEFTEWFANNAFNLDHLKAVGEELDKWRTKLTGIRKEAESIRKDIGTLSANGISTEMEMRDVEGKIPEAKFQMLKAQAHAQLAIKNHAENSAQLQLDALKREKEWLELLKKKDELQEKLNDEAEKENDERKKNLENLVKENAEQQRKEDSILRQRRAAFNADTAVGNARNAGREFTLDDLANSQNLRGSRWQRQAANILQLRQWAKENAMSGNFNLSNQQASRADELFKDLKSKNPFLKDPMDDLIQAADEQNRQLKQMITEGLPIKQS